MPAGQAAKPQQEAKSRGPAQETVLATVAEGFAKLIAEAGSLLPNSACSCSTFARSDATSRRMAPGLPWPAAVAPCFAGGEVWRLARRGASQAKRKRRRASARSFLSRRYFAGERGTADQSPAIVMARNQGGPLGQT